MIRHHAADPAKMPVCRVPALRLKRVIASFCKKEALPVLF
jgi:hypothetical protein